MENNKTPARPFSKKEAYSMVGVMALLAGGLLLLPPFIPLFAVSMMAVPVSVEIYTKGKDNILNKAWKELIT